MSYTVKSSEKLRKSGATGETKALLYLMNFRADSNQVHYFVVDFFNDLTGMDRYSEKLWDIQSKAARNNSPKVIGKELVTLFKNFMSELQFAAYILFIGGVTSTFRVNASLTTFGIDNVKEAARLQLIEGLIQEAHEKTYIDDDDITEENIDDFLNNIVFVVDDKEPYEYVKAIIKNHPTIIPDNEILTAIFNEIRDKQSEKKNSVVESITIKAPDEALKYCRHLTSGEIKLMTLHRIINRNPVDKGVPISFLPIYNAWPPERRKDMFDECKQSLCRALFNKNAADAFWALFEAIYRMITKKPQYTVEDIFRTIDVGTKSAVPDFDTISLEYFIATVKDGVQDDN